MRIKAFVNLCPAGLATMKYHENVEPSCWDVGRLRDVLTEHHDILLGLKIRISKEIVGDLGINVLKQAVNVAEKLGTRLAVHVTNPPEAMETVVKLLRPDDVLAHCYHGTGYTFWIIMAKCSQRFVRRKNAALLLMRLMEAIIGHLK